MGPRLSGFLGAVSFLTRVPARVPVVRPSELARAVPWFPVVGALVGIVIAVVYAVGLTILPSLSAATLGIGAGLLLTGAFHEDGLGDVADAFGGRDREDVLRILKDPRHGTFGVLAISCSLLVRVGAVSALNGWTAAAALPAAHALSRAAAVGLMTSARPAAADGLGAAYLAELTTSEAVVGVLGGCALTGVAIGVWLLPAAALAALTALAVRRLAYSKMGGISGDVLGATQQAAEIGVLLLASAVAMNDWIPLAWWR